MTAWQVPKMERFSIASASPLPGQPLAEHSLFVETWKALDLSGVPGFPLWESDLCALLQPVFSDVWGLFTTYATRTKPEALMALDGPAGSADRWLSPGCLSPAGSHQLPTDCFHPRFEPTGTPRAPRAARRRRASPRACSPTS